jgi:hypothetical protein
MSKFASLRLFGMIVRAGEGMGKLQMALTFQDGLTEKQPDDWTVPCM